MSGLCVATVCAVTGYCTYHLCSFLFKGKCFWKKKNTAIKAVTIPVLLSAFHLLLSLHLKAALVGEINLEVFHCTNNSFSQHVSAARASRPLGLESLI